MFVNSLMTGNKGDGVFKHVEMNRSAEPQPVDIP